MRVAVRRARSALSLFAPILSEPSLAGVSEGLRTLGQMLGPARDWDVFMTETVPPVMAALPVQTRLQTLVRAGTRHRHGVNAALSVWLAGPAFRLLVLDLACLTAAAPDEANPVPLRAFAASTLQTLWKKVRNSGRSLGKLDDPDLHRLRLKAKRLRYAAEFFAPLFPEKPAARFIRRLAVLQERLGIFNDSTVAEALLNDLSRAPTHAAGLVLGFTAARGAKIRPKIASAWARFRKRGPSWT